jgi:hypothetical protein
MNPPNSHAISEETLRNGTLTFLRTELQTGLTFALLAEEASYEDKINRNIKNAGKAFRCVKRFINRVVLSDEESGELHEKLEELERRLRILEAAVG